MNFLILGFVSFLPLFDYLGTQFLASATVDGVHGDTAFQLLELLLDLRALGLLLVQLVLKLTSHAIVTILRLLQVVTDLMHVGKSVQIFMLVKHLVCLFLSITIARVHENDFSLALFVELLKLEVFTTLVIDRLNQLTLHRWLTGQVTDTAVVLFIAALGIFLSTFIRVVLVRADERFSSF